VPGAIFTRGADHTRGSLDTTRRLSGLERAVRQRFVRLAALRSRARHPEQRPNVRVEIIVHDLHCRVLEHVPE
jgi:hypothetical protein